MFTLYIFNSQTKQIMEAPKIISGSFMTEDVKSYCKYHKLKFEKHTEYGFIASELVDVKAGMKYNVTNGNIISSTIRKIGSKRMHTPFACCTDGDIYINGKAHYQTV